MNAGSSEWRVGEVYLGWMAMAGEALYVCCLPTRVGAPWEEAEPLPELELCPHSPQA